MNKIMGVEEILTSKLQKIFGIRKVTFCLPGEDREQDALFVHVNRNRSSFAKNKMSFNISGEIKLFSQNEKVPYGFFNRKIEQAKKEDKDGFFFHGFDENDPYGPQNLSERKVSFTYLTTTQYDPDKGEINQLQLECN